MVGSRPEAAEAKAEFWLKENGHVTLPIDPIVIAEGLDITVKAKPDANPGVSGMLLRHGNEFGILYATHVKSIGYQRFSIAHELGHYLLEGHADLLFPDGVFTHYSKAGYVSIEPTEREADYFASGLLMPDNLFRSALRRCSEGLDGIQELSEKCLTSMTATAIKYAKRTTVPAAVIVSTDGIIDYAFLSGEMKEFPSVVWPKKGDRLPTGSLTSAFAGDFENVERGKRGADDCDLNLWLGGRKGLTAKEEVLGLGDYGKVLTVVTTDHLAEDGDEDEDLEDRWTPRFRR